VAAVHAKHGTGIARPVTRTPSLLAFARILTPDLGVTLLHGAVQRGCVVIFARVGVWGIYIALPALLVKLVLRPAGITAAAVNGVAVISAGRWGIHGIGQVLYRVAAKLVVNIRLYNVVFVRRAGDLHGLQRAAQAVHVLDGLLEGAGGLG